MDVSDAASSEHKVHGPRSDEPGDQGAGHANPIERLGERSGHQTGNEHFHGRLSRFHDGDADPFGDQDCTSRCAERHTTPPVGNNSQREPADEAERQAQADRRAVGQVETGAEGVARDFAEATSCETVQGGAGRQASGGRLVRGRVAVAGVLR